MKTTILVLSFLVACGAQASVPAYEVSILMGTGNDRMTFVRETVKDFVSFVPGANASEYTTGTIYFGWRNGIQSVQSIQILDNRGSSTGSLLMKGLELGAAASAIVLVPVGGGNFDIFCRRMAEKTETVFLVLMAVAHPRGGELSTSCGAGNILLVAGLNADLSDLGRFEAFGPALRLAIPAMNLSAPVDEGVSYSFANHSFGMAIAAGKMARLLRAQPGLRGAALVTRFLEEETDVLPALAGKVAGGRALTRFER